MALPWHTAAVGKAHCGLYLVFSNWTFSSHPWVKEYWRERTPPLY